MIIPSDKRLIVKTLKRDETVGKIHLSSESTMEHNLEYGEVLSELSEKFPKGTKIYYSRYSTARVMSDGQEVFIIPEVDVMAYDA